MENAAPLILVVDDDRGMLRLIEKTLQREGFATATADSARAALEWLENNRPSVMLLDLKLQDMEGAELINRLAAQGKTIPFIVITGQGDERVAVEMMKRGALDYLGKDVRFQEFVPAVVRRALDQLARDRRLAIAEEEGRNLARQLKADLEAMTCLQRLGAFYVNDGELKPILEEVVNAAVLIAHADFGAIQIVNLSGCLEIVAQRGFQPWWVEFWNNDPRHKGACGKALQDNRRVIVEDVQTSPIYLGTPGLEVLQRAGVCALQSTPLMSRSGKPLGVFSTHYKRPHRPDEQTLRQLDLLARQAADMIERQQAEAALRESHKRMKRVLEVETVGVIFWDFASGRVVDANETFLKLSGYSRAEVESCELTWWKLTSPALMEGSLAEARHLREAERFGPYEKELLCKDGSRKWFVFAASALGDHLGVEFCVDISARKRAEEALRERSEELAVLLDTLPAYVWVAHDAGCRMVTGNRAANEMAAVPVGTNVSQTRVKARQAHYLRQLKPNGSEYLPEELPLQRAVATGRPVRAASLNFIFPDGRRVLTVGDAVPLFDASGQVRGAVAAFFDITERNRMEQEILEIGERERRRFGQDLHDGLGQHLAGIELMMETVEQSVAAISKKDAAQIAKISGHLREAIRQSKALARGMSPVALQANGLMSALEELATNVSAMFRVRCAFRCPSPVLIRDNAVATHLFRIAQEATTNAFKHGRAKHIAIGLRRVNGEVVLTVRDDGSGFDPTSVRGNGIGLSSMAYRAQLAGGSLTVESAKGRGSVVTCSVPDSVTTTTE